MCWQSTLRRRCMPCARTQCTYCRDPGRAAGPQACRSLCESWLDALSSIVRPQWCPPATCCAPTRRHMRWLSSMCAHDPAGRASRRSDHGPDARVGRVAPQGLALPSCTCAWHIATHIKMQQIRRTHAAPRCTHARQVPKSMLPFRSSQPDANAIHTCAARMICDERNQQPTRPPAGGTWPGPTAPAGGAARRGSGWSCSSAQHGRGRRR